MGILKLGSIYKKKSKKEIATPPRTPSVPAPKLEPISLDLNLDLNNTSTLDTSSVLPVSTTPPSQQKNNSALPAGSGSFFDNIFAELGTKSNTEQDLLQDDFSLAIALSQQLQLQHDGATTKRMTGTTKIGNATANAKEKGNATSSNSSNILMGSDSIYSNYLRGISAIDSIDNSSSFQTSMFDSLLNKGTSSNNSTAPTNMTKSTTTTTIATQVVLDSDISDSDEESKNSEESEDDSLAGRMTKGVRPIMERRAQDNRLLVQRKIDNWSNRVDPDANRVDANESMIARMKDRHRNQVKMAALRQQELMGVFPHMVPQAYGAPQQQPLAPNNIVLPHPGMMMDPAQRFYASQPPIHDMTTMNNASPTVVVPPVVNTSQPPVALPASFLPNPTHVALSASYKKEGQEEQPQQQMEYQRPTMQQPVVAMSQSLSTQTINSRKSTMPPQPQPPIPSQPMMAPTNNSSFSSNHTNTSAKQQGNSAHSSVASLSSSALPQTSSPSQQEAEERTAAPFPTNKDEISVTVESPIPIADTPTPTTEEDDYDLAGGIEADAESSDDDERKSVILRKRKSSKKLRQKSEDDAAPHHRQVRSSRSAPNLKKKQSKKANSSKASSRRTSQEFTATSTPPSEMINTPPPLPTQFHEEYVLPRSNSHHQLAQQQHMIQHQYRQPLRHMKSEPELPRSGHRTNPNVGYHHQQQQLNLEWERMQAYQREQQLKSQYQYNQQQQPQKQHMSFMPMYTPVYYPTAATTTTPNTAAMPGMMPPYSGNMMDSYKQQQEQLHQRASHVMYGNNGSNVMMYSQQLQQPPQHMAGYYQTSSSR